MMLIDNGLYFFLRVSMDVSDEVVQAVFGVDNFESLLEWEDKCLPQLEDSDFNLRLNAIVERLRDLKKSTIQPLMVICEGDGNDSMIKDCFIEDLSNFKCSDYWSFLSHLHESVKDE